MKYLTIICLFFLYSCEKDKVDPPTQCCDPLETPEDYIAPVVFVENGIQFKLPSFQKGESNKFVYYKKDEVSGTYELRKHNMGSSLDELIVSNVRILNRAQWGSSNWVVFDNLNDYQIWAVKENGDSLFQVTTSQANLFPAFSGNGGYLIWSHTPNLANSHNLQRYSFLTSIIDTIAMEYSYHNDISINNELCSITTGGNISVSPLPATSFTSVFQSNNAVINGLCWSSDGQSIFFTSYDGVEGGIYEYDLNNGILDTLKCSCNSKYYKSPSSSSDGNTLILERVDQSLEYGGNGNFLGNVLMNSKVVKIDLNTLEEEVILQ